MATGTYVSPGETINYSTGSAIVVNTLVLIGKLLGIVVRGVSTADVALGREASVLVAGRIIAPKLSTDVVTQGAPLYWDAGNSRLTITASTHTFAGFAAAASDGSTATVEILLQGMNT